MKKVWIPAAMFIAMMVAVSVFARSDNQDGQLETQDGQLETEVNPASLSSSPDDSATATSQPSSDLGTPPDTGATTTTTTTIAEDVGLPYDTDGCATRDEDAGPPPVADRSGSQGPGGEHEELAAMTPHELADHIQSNYVESSPSEVGMPDSQQDFAPEPEKCSEAAEEPRPGTEPHAPGGGADVAPAEPGGTVPTTNP